METTLTNVNAYENAVRTQAGAADIRAQLLDSLAKSKAVVDSVFGKIEEIDRMKAESEQLRKKISTVIPGKATMLTMLSVLSLLVFGLFGAPVVLSIFRVTDPGTIYLTFILVPTVPFVSILLIRSRVVKEARAQEQADFMRDADLLDSRIQADFRQITAVLESDRGIYAKNHIPEDYFYPEAVAMFQYYIRNGQADSMKEALREYDQYLHRFPAYLQQLTMESNGKHVRWDGSAVTSDTGEIFWGEPGTNVQHAFYQLLHQGTVVVPADFIAFANTANPATDSGQDVHELFLGNFLAQTKALAFGKTADEVRAEGTPEQIVPARCFEGNRPTTSIFGDTLTPFALGELIALYEHITFVEGTVWGIDSYDQWGVELGKQLAKQITPAFHDDAAKAEQDASTQALIEFYRAHRK